MANERKRMHIHLIDAAINLRGRGYRVRVYPRCEVYAAGRLEFTERAFRIKINGSSRLGPYAESGAERGRAVLTMNLDTFSPNPRYWRWVASCHWILYQHCPASIIPRRKCQLSELDAAARADHVGDGNMVKIPVRKTQRKWTAPVVEQLSLGV